MLQTYCGFNLIYTINTSDVSQSELPDNTKIGELRDLYLENFPRYTSFDNVTLRVEINSTYSPGLAAHDSLLEYRVYLTFHYALVNVRGIRVINFEWIKLTP